MRMDFESFHLKSIFILFSLIVLFSCEPQERAAYDLYTMEEFNHIYAYEFVSKIKHIPEIYSISIVDTRADGNDFSVNGQWIFLDTTQEDKLNYYSYKKRAAELKVSPDSLLQALKVFYKMCVNEFNRDENYFRFPVVVGFNTNRGYLYTDLPDLQPGDTLPATSVKNKDYHFKLVMVKQFDKKWFEYFER